MSTRAVLALVLALAPGLAWAKKKPEVDHLQLAAILVGDGNYDRAELALQQVDPEADDLDRPRFHLVRGLIRLNRGLYRPAAEDFSASIAATEARRAESEDAPPVEPVVYVYLGQASFYAGDYAAALDAMAKAGAKADTIRSTFALRAEALWKLERKDEAWGILNRGMARFPGYSELLRRKVFYAIDLGLHHLAVDLGAAYLSRSEAGVADHLAIARALQKAGEPRRALALLELAHLEQRDAPLVGVELARAYAELEAYRTAAELMERVALRGVSEAWVEAAELWRQAGELFHALALNRNIADSPLRLRQRLTILLDMRDYALIAAMERDLERARLLEDEPIRYAVAFSNYQEGDFEATKRLLSGISEPELFRKAAELRQSMARCEKEPWSC